MIVSLRIVRVVAATKDVQDNRLWPNTNEDCEPMLMIQDVNRRNSSILFIDGNDEIFLGKDVKFRCPFFDALIPFLLADIIDQRNQSIIITNATYFLF